MADPKIRLKRSSVENKIPTPDQVPLGEIALNTYDGYLYASKNVGVGTTVVAINPFRVGTGTNTYNAYFTAGNVGIGSEIPSTKLDVDGTVTATGASITGNITVSGTVDGRDVATDGTKLDAIEASADVTDATNVAAAGAVMESDATTANMSFVVDEDNMASDSATKVPTQQSVKAYVDANAGGGGSGLFVQTDVGIHTLSNVGIGTTNPVAKLEINVGSATTALDIQGSEGQLFSVTNQLSSGSIFSVNDISGIPSIDVDADGTIQLAPTGTEYVGIGTTNPQHKLHVVGNTNIVGVVTATSFSGDITGNVTGNLTGDVTGIADTATTATNVTVSANNSADETVYPIFVDGATGAQGAESDTGLTYNPSTGTLTATTFSGTVEVSTDTTPQLGGDLDVNTNNINFGDSGSASDDRLTFGAGTDLSIYHNSNDSYIDNNTRHLYIRTNVASDTAGNIYLKPHDDENGIIVTHDGEVQLYYDNAEKLNTSTDGITVTGTGLATVEWKVNDNKYFTAGTGDDFLIYHNGTNTFLDNNTNHLFIRNNVDGDDGGNIYLRPHDNEEGIIIQDDGEVQLYYDNVEKLNTSSDGITVTGTGLATVEWKVNDNKYFTAGTGDDFRIYHNGSSTYLDNNTGSILIRANVAGDVGGNIYLRPHDNEEGIIINDDGEVQLYYDNAEKLNTSSDGITVTGTGLATNAWKVNDDDFLIAGTGDDLKIWHSGASSFIDNNTSHLFIRTNVDGDDGGNIYLRPHDNEEGIIIHDDGAVELYYDNSKKVETSSTGVTITGTGLADGWKVNDSEYFTAGTGDDFQIYHNGFHTYLDNDTGHLYIRNNVAGDVNGNIYLRPHDDEEGIVIHDDGAVELYYDNSKKVETSSTGVTITGNVTATTFIGDVTGNVTGNATGLSGSPNITVTNITAADITASGTLTYEDVTNIDSIGIVTARSGIEFGASGVGGTVTAAGNAEFAGIVTATTFDGSLATSNLSGTVTNAQLAGSIANGKLANSSIAIGGITFNLGDTDATPAFDLSDATSYPFTSLTGITTEVSGDTSPQLGGNLDLNSKTINGTGTINITGIATATNIVSIKSDDGTPGRVDLYCETNNAHYARIQAPDHSDFSGNITLTLPNSTGTLLNSDGSGASLTALNASNLGSGTIPDARFPATLPAVSGANLTSLTATNVTVSANNSTNETVYPIFVDGATGAQGAETDTGLNYNPSTGNLTSTLFTGNVTGDVTGNADTATTATNVTVSANNSADETVYPIFVDGATGAQGAESDTGLTYNPSSGTLTATTFSGSGSSLTGLTGASAATYGDGSNVAAITVDSNGRITGISEVSISGGGGGASEAFKTISVSGQSDVVADSATDTLTLVAGSNMTITTNASGDSITFASSGGGGGGSIGIRSDGTVIQSSASNLNFIGTGITMADDGSVTDITIPTVQRTPTRIVASGGQTAFTVASYNSNQIDVYLNGAKLDSTEFTETDSTTITLTQAASANDVFESIGFSNYTGVNVTSANSATTATTSTNVTVADESSDTTCFPLFATAATGDLPPKTDASALTYNASNGTLSATTFSGSLTGNVTGNLTGTATTATNITVADESSDTTCFPLFVTTHPGDGSGDYPPKLDSSFTYNASAEILGAGTFQGSLDVAGLLKEGVNITAGKLSANTNIDLTNGMVHLFTTTETATSTPNIRFNSSTTLDSSMSTGESITVVLISAAAAAGYSAQLTIDGSAVTESWLGGSAPSAGGSSGYDVYTYNIIKTGSATFVVLANLVNFA